VVSRRICVMASAKSSFCRRVWTGSENCSNTGLISPVAALDYRGHLWFGHGQAPSHQVQDSSQPQPGDPACSAIQVEQSLGGLQQHGPFAEPTGMASMASTWVSEPFSALVSSWPHSSTVVGALVVLRGRQGLLPVIGDAHWVVVRGYT
jgi:hypothetical protein